MKRVAVLLAFLVSFLFFFTTICCARRNILDEWDIFDENPDPKTLVEFSIALKLKNIEILEKMVLDRSNPASPLYSKWLNKDTILDLIAPHPSVPQAIIDHFSSQCSEREIKRIQNRRDSLKLITTIGCVQRALKMTIHTYKHKRTGYLVHRRSLTGANPRLPEPLHSDTVDLISGLVALPKVRRSVRSRDQKIKKSQEFAYNIPDTMRRVYSIPEGFYGNHTGNTQAVIEFLPEGVPDWSDLQDFSEQAGEIFNNITQVIGPVESGFDSSESILDIEYITTVGAVVETWYITIASGWIYEMANDLFSMPNFPLVVSVSYGWPETYTCETDVTGANCTDVDSQGYIQRSEAELAKVAALGISVIVASQDEGAPSEANEFCELDNSPTPLFPIYPGSSAWATSVSATDLVEASRTSTATSVGRRAVSNNPPICNEGYPCSTGTLEFPTMANNTYYQWTTGGGFSNYTAMPSYQAAAVNQWLTIGSMIPPSWAFTSTNRGYPDISAIGDRILIIEYGSIGVSAGTSASTPIIAGMVSLMNSARLKAGKAPLGFLNTLLYKMPASVFQDIIGGNNAWSRDPDTPCEYGYSADAGWDPVNGIGTPNFQQMLNYVMTLP